MDSTGGSEEARVGKARRAGLQELLDGAGRRDGPATGATAVDRRESLVGPRR
jgi:hypothetical protein